MAIAVLLNVIFMDSTAQDADPMKEIIRDVNLNDGAETYALSFRTLDKGLEAWITMASEVGDVGSRLLARSVCTPEGFRQPVIVDDEALNARTSLYNGVPTFNPCNPNEAVVVSDRAASGTSRRSNDLYLVQYDNNKWTSHRMSVNSSGWDDTPAFGTNGNTLYFSSDRRNPGSGAADLFVSKRNGSEWSEPVLLSSICTDRHHEASPFVSPDGRLYYSTNTHGDQDIWSVALDAESGLPAGEPIKLEIPGVNVKGSDEYHPVISPGGSWLIFSSNRLTGVQHGEFRLYYKRLPPIVHTLNLRVTARTKIRDVLKQKYFGKLDSIFNVRTSIEVQHLPSVERSGLNSDADGRAAITISSANIEGPYADTRTQTFVLSATPHTPGFTGGVDTVVIDVTNCTGDFDHVLYLDDTTSQSKNCEFTFRTFNVPFFVTTYWCPTTRKYRKYTPCTSLFVDDVNCETLSQPEHCTTNEAYQYTFVPAKLVRSARSGENCVNYDEFNENGAQWADVVDANIERMRDEVSAVLNEPCIQEAISRGNDIEVTYIGTTDDRSIHPKCQYTGLSLNEIRKIAPDIDINPEIASFIENGKRFNGGGYGGNAGGNQLLSDLRSLYFAILFDNVCKETITTYRNLRSAGRIKVASRGQAIDQRDLPYEFKRAAGVDIRIPKFEMISKGFDAHPHRTIHLCEGGTCR